MTMPNPLYPIERSLGVVVGGAWDKRVKHRQRNLADASKLPTASTLLEDPQYPQTWDEYIGQEEAKSVIQDAIRRAVHRDEVTRHILIACRIPGIGKTALAVLAARQIGSRCFTVSGKMGQAEAQAVLSQMHRGDVLFIDEIHRLVQGGKANAEWLLHLLQDGVLMGPSGPIAKLDITVIGATTDVGRLPETVIDRFSVRPVLTQLDGDDALMIAYWAAERLFPPAPVPDTNDLKAFVLAADFNPRRITQLLQVAVDLHYSVDGYNVEEVLRRTRMTLDGLDDVSQRYLVLLANSHGPMGEAQVRNLLGESGGLAYIERRLNDKGLLTFSRSGRVLTRDGEARAAELIAEGVTL